MTVDQALDSARDLVNAGALAEAETTYRRVLAVRPNHKIALNGLGAVAHRRHDYALAEQWFRSALFVDADFAAAASNLGIVLRERGHPAAAIPYLERALALEAETANAHVHLGNALGDLGRDTEAIACYERALALDPELAGASFAMADKLLRLGDYARGWAFYRARWRISPFIENRRSFTVPEWDGTDPAGRTMLVYAEQGLGDVIQFCRYLPLLEARGARTVLLVDRGWSVLEALLRGLEGAGRIALDLAEAGRFDVQCPLLELPRLFGTELGSVPATVPYLTPDPDRRAAWRRRLEPAGGALRVGLVWAGNPEFSRDRVRSPGLEPLVPLLALPGVRWYGLQVGAGRRDLENRRLPDGFVDLGPELRDFADTAAVMAEIDLIVSSCTGPAHLAGALGRPTWIMLPAVPDWRWLLGRDDSPWYPTVRLFRQPTPGDWADVTDKLFQALVAMRTPARG